MEYFSEIEFLYYEDETKNNIRRQNVSVSNPENWIRFPAFSFFC